MEQVLWNIYSTCMTFVPPLRLPDLALGIVTSTKSPL